jgi:hypothetical protein
MTTKFLDSSRLPLLSVVGIHKTLRVTPAMAAGVTDRLWEISDIVALLEAVEPKLGKRGPYKPRQPKAA